MNEFELIERCFRPLAADFPGALELADDAALLSPPPGHQLVVSADMLNEGVHFLGSEDPALIARKALRVNLSDLAAKGAEPWCYFLTLAIPAPLDEVWITRFCEGLAEDQREFGIALLGGDTTSTIGKISISITALGHVPEGMMLRRSGGNPGDILCVSGTLGDAAEGLRLLREDTPPSDPLVARYLLPQPRTALGLQLRGLASAAMDISDGLAQDLRHLCRASSVGAVVHAKSIPRAGATLEQALGGGDDYEILFAVPPEKIGSIPEGCTRIGRLTEGEEVAVLDAVGVKIPVRLAGWQHF